MPSDNLRQSPTTPPRALRIAFICVENSNRSQMAEAFARAIGGKDVEPYSAGSRPSGQVNPRAIESMRRVGYDISRQSSKQVELLWHLELDAVVTMGCGDECPNLHVARRIEWDIPDPRELAPRQFDEVRDLIGQKVRALIAELRGMEM